MTMIDYLTRKTPEYSDTMFLDGYSPSQILAAAHKSMLREFVGESQEETVVVISSETEAE